MFKSKQVANGVRVVSVETNNYKTAEINISMVLPLNEDSAANALTINLLKRSCKDYPEFSLLRGKLDNLYGAAISAGALKSGESQVLTIGLTCLDDKFSLDGESIIKEGVELLSSMLFKPNIRCKSFGKDNLEAERKLLIQRIIDEQDDKRTYANQRLIELMCKDEVYGRPKYGTIDEIKNVKMSDVYNSYLNLISKSLIQVTYVGSLKSEEICDLFEKKFSSIERTPYKPYTEFITDCGEFKRFEEKLPVNQGKFVMGFRTGMKSSDDNYYAYKVMVDIFGGGTYSKLFTIIREKMSLCYYCRAVLGASKGICVVDCGIDTENEKAAFEGILKQLEDVKNGEFDDEVLDFSKKSIRERLTFSTPDAILGWYDSQCDDEEILTPEFVIENVEKVTKQQVMECAGKMSLDTVFMIASEEVSENED